MGNPFEGRTKDQSIFCYSLKGKKKVCMGNQHQVTLTFNEINSEEEKKKEKKGIEIYWQ